MPKKQQPKKKIEKKMPIQIDLSQKLANVRAANVGLPKAAIYNSARAKYKAADPACLLFNGPDVYVTGSFVSKPQRLTQDHGLPDQIQLIMNLEDQVYDIVTDGIDLIETIDAYNEED